MISWIVLVLAEERKSTRILITAVKGVSCVSFQLQLTIANDPVFDEPTLGVLVKDTFYLIANSQWGAIDEKGQLAPADKLKEPVVLKVKL